MHLDRWLRVARLIGQRGDLARRSAIAAVALAERLLGPILVNVATFAGVLRSLAIGALLSSVFALRGILQSAHVARTQAALYVRVVDAVLRQDVVQSTALADEDARATLFEGGQRIASVLAEGLPNLCANLGAAAAFAAFVAFTQPARTVEIAAIAFVGGILLLTLSHRAIEPAQREEQSAWVAVANGINGAFDGRLEIVAAGRRETYAAAFSKLASAWSTTAVRATRVLRVAGRLPLLVLAMSVGLAIVVDGVVRGESPDRILSRAALIASMSPAFVGIAQGLQEMARSEQRLQSVLGLVAEQTPAPARGGELADHVRWVATHDVHFAYKRGQSRRPALAGMSFTWRKGELLALTGSNGCGKSTCLRVLLGLAIPDSGAVLVDSIPLGKVDLDAWRRGVAFLPQRPYLPPGMTVRECLRFIDPDIGEEVMATALQRVGLAKSLAQDAQSWADRPVDQLSVGQKQRVGLARVLCRQAPIVMLDEPDANLDHEGVEMVSSLVRELSKDRMVIIAVHSSVLLAAADRVLTIESGRITAESSRQAPPLGS